MGDRIGRRLLAGLALALLAATVIVAGRLARERAAADVAERAAAALPLAASALSGVIEKERLIPLILARDPEVIALLAGPDPAAEARLDAKLADIAAEAGAAVIYLVGRDGIAVAASNAGGPGSFVGNDYGFRTYFTGAMRDGTAAQYALGTVSGRPGLYLSRRVESARGPLGVVVVKVEFDALETSWRDAGFVVHVADAAGVVLATSEPGWRFGTVAPLADEAAARAALRLDDRAFRPLPIRPEGALDRIGEAVYARAEGPVGAAAPGWVMTLFAPAEAAVTAAGRTAQLTALLSGLLIAAGALALARRRRGALARAAALAEMTLELERRVAARTEELNRTNSALAAEIAEREGAENRVRRLRDDLAQANRLSILGQITAGVAHEINQPVAAIRAYGETGGLLLDGGRVAEARGNFGAIVAMTDRIGAITAMLRGFSRRGAGTIGPVAVEEAIDGALALLAGQIREAGARIERGPPRVPPVRVMAGRIRLEQILVNLLRNALEAMRGQPDPVIRFEVSAGTETVSITVRDNGPGLDPAVREQIFMPFTTTKETGLGLGLVISSDIAREFGGELRLEEGPAPGAAFTLRLARAA